jgi:hypothetical protein
LWQFVGGYQVKATGRSQSVVPPPDPIGQHPGVQLVNLPLTNRKVAGELFLGVGERACLPGVNDLLALDDEGTELDVDPSGAVTGGCLKAGGFPGQEVPFFKQGLHVGLNVGLSAG